jgi:hypothetical protein
MSDIVISGSSVTDDVISVIVDGDIVIARDSAQASASAALVSEQNALASAELATSKSAIAVSSASTATIKASEALASANSASIDASSAATSEINASTYATNALNAANDSISAKDISVAKASEASISESNALASATGASASEANALSSKNSASSSATTAQLKAWESEAERLTADSYANQQEDVYVVSYTSNGDGTFSQSDTTDYSSYHWSQKSQHTAGDTIDVLGDVDTTGKIDGDSLVWNSTTGMWEASSISVPTPTITITTTMNEGQTVTDGSITNYNSNFSYTIEADSGTISSVSGSSFRYTAPDIIDGGVSAPYTDTIRITATFGFFTSQEATKVITYVYVPLVADSAVTFSFATDTENNTGWTA